MDEVRKFPTPPMTAEDIAEIKAMFTAAPLTRRQLLTERPEVLYSMGPWVAEPGTELSDVLMRIAAIVQGLSGPGRVPLRDGLEVVRDLCEHVLMGVKK